MAEKPTETKRRSFVGSAALTWGAQIAMALLSLGNVLIVSRTLGPVGRGEVAFLTTIGTLVAYLADMGVNQANSNFAGRKPELRPALATNSVVFALALAALAAGVLTAIINAFPGVGGDTTESVRWIALAGVPSVILVTYLTNLLQAEYAFVLTNAAVFSAPLLNTTVNGILAATGNLTVTRAISTWAVSWALAALILLAAQASRGGFGRPDVGLGRSSLWFGLKAHASRVLLVGNYRIDQWLVGTLGGSRELGLYSVAVAWSEGLFYLPTALVTVQRPDVVRASPREAARQTIALFRVAALITAFLAGVLALAAPFLCATIFGHAFAGSANQLRILAIGGVGIVALKLFGQALTAQRKPMLETAGVVVAFLVGLSLDLLLIPDHGGLGAAVAAAIAYTAGGAAIILIFVRTLGGRAADFAPRGSDLALLRRVRPTGRAEVEVESP
jgi:O-antigen/teichoic acid export membrane protein